MSIKALKKIIKYKSSEVKITNAETESKATAILNILSQSNVPIRKEAIYEQLAIRYGYEIEEYQLKLLLQKIDVYFPNVLIRQRDTSDRRLFLYSVAKEKNERDDKMNLKCEMSRCMNYSNGKCKALNSRPKGECRFYKTVEQNNTENAKNFQRLQKLFSRKELIRKYSEFYKNEVI